MEIARRMNRHFGQRGYDKGLQLHVFGHCLVGTLAAHYIPYIANRIRGVVVDPTFNTQQIAQSTLKSYTYRPAIGWKSKSGGKLRRRRYPVKARKKGYRRRRRRRRRRRY